MSDMFKDLIDKAKDALDPIGDKAKEVVESGELKEKAGDIVEKATPVIEKVRDVAGDVIEKVKGGATELFTGDKPDLEIKNDLFDKLDEEVAESKDTIQEKAAEMEAKIKEMLGGGKQE